MSTVSKSDLVLRIADALGTSSKTAESALNITLAAIMTEVNAGNTVKLKGFGSFVRKHSPARMARNPRTGEQIEVPARDTLRFRPSKLA